MKVLIVCRATKGVIRPFISEQMESLAKLQIELLLFKINNKGIVGYLSNIKSLKDFIKANKPDIIHAHYGLSGLLANFQRKVPVVTTFHGSDINSRKVLWLSKMAHKLSLASIFVSEEMKRKVSAKGLKYLIPCGVNLSLFKPLIIDLKKSPSKVKKHSINILFSSSFSNPIKNFHLAKCACILAEEYFREKINLIELIGYDRIELSHLINSVDCLILTSFSEGSPQIIKEAMACNCPIVSTDVGDVKWVLGDTEGCYIASYDATDVANKINLALNFAAKKGRTIGRKRILELGLDLDSVANRIIHVYLNLISKSVV